MLVLRVVEDELAVDDVDDDGLVAVDLALEQLTAHLVHLTYCQVVDREEGGRHHRVERLGEDKSGGGVV